MYVRVVHSAAAWSALVFLVAAAGGSTSPAAVRCGMGTRLSAGVCVPYGLEAGTLDPGLDATEQAPPDGASDASDCPVASNASEVVLNCDPACGPLWSGCNVARCRTATEKPTDVQNPYRDSFGLGENPAQTFVTLRLPADPWKLYGECNPEQKLRNGNPSWSQEKSFANPQPRFALMLRLPLPDVLPDPDVNFPLVVDPGKWSYRLLNDTSREDQGGGSLYLSGASRAEPQPYYPSDFVNNKDHRYGGCAVLDRADVHRSYPFPTAGYTRMSAPKGLLILVTNLEHVPATNVTFDLRPNAVCGGK